MPYDRNIGSLNGDTSEEMVARLCSFDVDNSVRALSMFRAASPLPEDAQRLIDDAVVRVGRQNLVLVNDLLAAGLTRPLPNWLGVMELGYDRTNDAGQAMRTMDLDVRGERFVLARDRRVIPIYATHDDFSFGARELAAAERVGQPLDTSHVEQATRNVNLAIEDQAINGWELADGTQAKVNGNSAPGLLTAPANTYQYTGSNKAWNHASKTGLEILTDVLAMVDLAKADGYFGPFNFYMPTAYWSTLFRRYSDGTTTFDTSIMEQIERITAGGRAINFREVPQLPANRTALVQMTSNVIDVIVGQTPAEVSWTSGNGWRRFFVVVACMITRIKEDYDGKSGIVVGNV